METQSIFFFSAKIDQLEIVKETKDTVPVLKNVSSSWEKQNIHIRTKQLKNTFTQKQN